MSSARPHESHESSPVQSWRSRAAHIARRVSVFGGATAIISYPVSVSVSQGGLVLALLAWAASILIERSGGAALIKRGSPAPGSGPILPLLRHPALWFALALYGIQLIALVINALGADSFGAFFVRGARSEFKDVFLLGMAFWTGAYASRPDQRRRLERWFWIALVILLVSGIVSVFSLYRLHKLPYHLANGWEAGPNARFQHYSGTLIGGAHPVHLYMPIGLMNTHLTYGGLLMMAAPVLVFRSLALLFGPAGASTPQTEAQLQPGGWRRWLPAPAEWRWLPAPAEWRWLPDPAEWRGLPWHAWVWPVALLLTAIVFFLNNGRSAIFGMLVATGCGFYVLARTTWRARIARLAPFLFLAIVSLVVLDRVSADAHGRFRQLASALFGREKHTDFQRTLVWQGALRMVGENPLFGVGPGNFEQSVLDDVIAYGKTQPHLWVAYELAQRGHAHNDMLHFLSIAGVPALLAYLLFFGLYVRHVLRTENHGSGSSERGPPQYWKWGPIAVLGAGLFQCYFQDDEILLPFWALVGYALAESPEQAANAGEQVAA